MYIRTNADFCGIHFYLMDILKYISYIRCKKKIELVFLLFFEIAIQGMKYSAKMIAVHIPQKYIYYTLPSCSMRSLSVIYAYSNNINSLLNKIKLIII